MEGIKLSKIIKDLLDSNENLTQAGLAKKCGVSSSTVNKWVHGKLRISEKNYSNIKDYLKVGDLKSLISESEKNDESNLRYELIREDLKKELEIQGKFAQHYSFLVDHAVHLFQLVDQLQADVDKFGLRVSLTTGNGHSKEVDNASIKNLNAVSSQLMRVLKELGINSLDTDSEDKFELDAL